MAEDNPQGIASEADKKAAHIAALERELVGYQLRIETAKEAGDDVAEARYTNRAQQVEDQLDHYRGATKGRAKTAGTGAAT